MTTLTTEIPVIEISRIFYTGITTVLRIISVNDIDNITVNYESKSIDITLKTVDDNGVRDVENYYDEDKSYVTMRFTNVIKVY